MTDYLTPSFAVAENTGSNSVMCARSDGNGNLYYGMNDGTFGGVRMDSGQALNNGNTAALGSGFNIICVVGASSVVGSSGSNTFKLVESSSLYFQTYPNGGGNSWANAGVNRHPQQYAFNAASNAVLGGTNTNGGLVIFHTDTLQSHSSSIGGSEKITCTIPRDGTQNFFCGTSSGHVIEIDPGINQISTLAITPKCYGDCSIAVTSLSYYNDVMLVSDDRGILWIYQWSTKTLLDRRVVSSQGGQQNKGGVSLNVFGTSASGQVMYSQFSDSGVFRNSVVIGEISSGVTPGFYVNSVISSNMGPCWESGIDYGVNKAWTVDQYRVSVYDIVPGTISQIPTRIQDPPGADKAGRIIRIKIPSEGAAWIYSDQNLSAGPQSLPSTAGDYYELALIGTYPNQRWDWRRYNQ